MPAQEFGRTMPFCMAIVPILHRECCLAWPGYDAFICMTSEAGTDVPSQIGHPGISGEFVEMAPTAAGKIPCWPKYKPPTPPQKMSSSQVTVASVSLPSFVSHRGLFNTHRRLSANSDKHHPWRWDGDEFGRSTDRRGSSMRLWSRQWTRLRAATVDPDKRGSGTDNANIDDQSEAFGELDEAAHSAPCDGPTRLTHVLYPRLDTMACFGSRMCAMIIRQLTLEAVLPHPHTHSTLN